jgi:hypothetical protein
LKSIKFVLWRWRGDRGVAVVVVIVVVIVDSDEEEITCKFVSLGLDRTNLSQDGLEAGWACGIDCVEKDASVNSACIVLSR